MIVKGSHVSQDHFKTIESERPIIKYYYTTPEISELIGEVQSCIRFWTKEFKVYKKNKGYKRYWMYPRESVAKLHIIKNLLRNEKHTLEGAKLKLRYINP